MSRISKNFLTTSPQQLLFTIFGHRQVMTKNRSKAWIEICPIGEVEQPLMIDHTAISSTKIYANK